MTGQPFLCPDCSCPLQLLADGYTGETRGTIEDALEAHRRTVHKDLLETDA